MRLRANDVYNVVALLPEPVKVLLRAHPVVVAGGAVRDVVAGLEVKDLDVFCHSEEQAKTLAYALALYEGCGLPTKSLNAYNVPCAGLDGLPVQFVFYRDYADAADLVGQFDFRACAAAVYADGDGWTGVALEGFYGDVQRRVLTFTNQAKDAGSLVPLRRALKLAAKGWKVPDEPVEGILTHWEPTLALKPIRKNLGPSYGGAR